MIGPLYAETNKRRDKIQILSDIIKVTNRPTKMTRILRLANIQYNKFQECIDILLSVGFLERISIRDKFRRFRDKRTDYAYKATKLGAEWSNMVDDIYKTLQTF